MRPPVLTSIGTVLIDQFKWYDLDGNATAETVQQLGGGSLYAIIGARMFLDATDLKMMINTESGGLEGELEDLVQFGREIWYPRPGASMPKTLIEYRGKGRTFKYTQPPVDISPMDFVNTPIMKSEYVHLVASPSRVLRIVEGFEALSWYPKIVWEPHPMFCTPDLLPSLRSAMRKVHVLSPNHEEIAEFFDLRTTDSDLTKADVNLIAQRLLDDGIGPDGQGSVVVRCGSKGSCVGTREGGLEWLGSYWQQHDQGKVVDTTGAGNAFLGGVVAGLYLENDDIYAAVPYGTVSASLVIQQFGLPEFQGQEGEKVELWNGEDPRSRLKDYLSRLRM